MGHTADDAIIADRAEFADALQCLNRGHMLVRVSDSASGCVLDGALVYHSFHTLRRYGLIDLFDNPEGFPGVEYYRITPQGREFAERVWEGWRARPPLERMLVRLTG